MACDNLRELLIDHIQENFPTLLIKRAGTYQGFTVGNSRTGLARIIFECVELDRSPSQSWGRSQPQDHDIIADTWQDEDYLGHGQQIIRGFSVFDPELFEHIDKFIAEHCDI